MIPRKFKLLKYSKKSFKDFKDFIDENSSKKIDIIKEIINDNNIHLCNVSIIEKLNFLEVETLFDEYINLADSNKLKVLITMANNSMYIQGTNIVRFMEGSYMINFLQNIYIYEHNEINAKLIIDKRYINMYDDLIESVKSCEDIDIIIYAQENGDLYLKNKLIYTLNYNIIDSLIKRTKITNQLIETYIQKYCFVDDKEMSKIYSCLTDEYFKKLIDDINFMNNKPRTNTMLLYLYIHHSLVHKYDKLITFNYMDKTTKLLLFKKLIDTNTPETIDIVKKICDNKDNGEKMISFVLKNNYRKLFDYLFDRNYNNLLFVINTAILYKLDFRMKYISELWDICLNNASSVIISAIMSDEIEIIKEIEDKVDIKKTYNFMKTTYKSIFKNFFDKYFDYKGKDYKLSLEQWVRDENIDSLYSYYPTIMKELSDFDAELLELHGSSTLIKNIISKCVKLISPISVNDICSVCFGKATSGTYILVHKIDNIIHYVCVKCVIDLPAKCYYCKEHNGYKYIVRVLNNDD